MDPITQGALGAATAHVLLYRQDKHHHAWIVGGLAGMAADLDLLISSANDPMLLFLYHRHFTHSLSFIPIGGLLVAAVLMIFKCFSSDWWLTCLAALIGYATHGFLDSCTSYGTVWYWPFSTTRVNWDIVSIIDPLVTFPLVLGIAWTLIHKTRRGVIGGLVLAGLVLAFHSFQHHRAILAANLFAKERHWKITRLRAFPKLASSTVWQGLALVNGDLLAMDINTPLMKSSKIDFWVKLPLFLPTELPNNVKKSSSQLRDFTIFNWFCDGYLILVNKQPLVLADGRFLISGKPLIALWGIQFLPNKPHVNKLNFIKLESIK